MRNAPLLAAPLALGLVVAAFPAGADEAGTTALAAIDAATNRAKTLTLSFEETVQEGSKPETKRELRFRAKGPKRLLEIGAPADLKGTKVLVESPTSVYVFLPSFGKVRRLSNTGEGLFGSAFSVDDFAVEKLGTTYTATAFASAETEVKVVLGVRPGQSAKYPKLDVTATKDKNLPTELKFFDAKGKLVRTETRSGYACGDGGVCLPGQRKMVDHVKNVKSTLTLKSSKVDAEIADDVFSKRSLAD